MMFRVNHGKYKVTVQCIRTLYDREKKRSAQKVIAAFDGTADKIPSHALEALEPHERDEALAWHSAYRYKLLTDQESNLPERVPFKDCPVGAFLFEGVLYVKTYFHSAFCVKNGYEFTNEHREELLVLPITASEVDTKVRELQLQD